MMESNASLAIMIVASIIVSYFLTMTIILRKNSTHQRNKLFQALLMGAWMGVIMIGSMWYLDKKISRSSAFILVILILVVAILTYFIRQQTTIDQDQFMLGMIEHHQMAIDMANLVKPKVTNAQLGKIVDNIVSSQEKEIAEMYEILGSRGVPNNPLASFRFL
jgi:uncharacterized membrane protein YczE